MPRSIPNKEKQRKRLKEAINSSIESFNATMEKCPVLSNRQTLELENRVINNSGASSQSKGNKYVRFELKNSHFVLQPTIPTGCGNWIVERVPFITDYSDRANVIIYNSEIGIRIKFLFNFKNNEKVLGIPEKAEAKLGLGTPSWNIWIYKM